uniref:Uncharacterized protein n=1 Tax=viral metagenome TaxID=1070528 RepID=A0A6C0HV06_9ZZZZ
MTSINTDMFNSTNSHTINDITNEAKAVIKTIKNEKIVFMKECYKPDGYSKRGSYHHIWNFYVFTCDLNGEIRRRHFNREYNERSGEKSIDNPYEETNFTQSDVEFLKDILELELDLEDYD